MNHRMKRSAREPSRLAALLDEIMEASVILFPEVSYTDLRVSSLILYAEYIHEFLSFGTHGTDIPRTVSGSQVFLCSNSGPTT